MIKHIPVLAQKLIELTKPQKGECFVDVTAGYGGHSELLLQAVGKSGKGFLFDRDPQAVKALQSKFKSCSNLHIANQDFSDIDWSAFNDKIDIVVADLGVSSAQLDEPHRGFGFKNDGPLDMRMDPNSLVSASSVVNSYSEKELADIIYQFGQETKSRSIAYAIVQHRKQQAITTTKQLHDIVCSVVKKRGKIDPATKTFQAIRIEVNGELSALEHLLQTIPKTLKNGGRVAVISFHSLEDRKVKQKFKTLSSPQKDDNGNIVQAANFRLVTKKPIKGSEFDKSNRRARSAMLRVLEKIN